MDEGSSKTKIAQVNIHHAKAASAIASRMFIKQQLGIMLLQEPWYYRGQIRGLSSKDAKVIWDTKQECPRTCILISKNINYLCLSDYLTRDLVPIQVQLEIQENQKMDIVIASAYFAGDNVEIPPLEVQKLVRHCNTKGLPLIIGCDANAHNEVWGSSDTNSRGEYLLEFLIKENLNIANIGNTPTFKTRVREEVLDITIVSPNIRSCIGNWRVSKETSMSDHCTILFELTGLNDKHIPYRNPRKTDWESFNNKLENGLRQIQVKKPAKHYLDLENEVDHITEVITSSYENSCPLITKNREREVRWWNRNLSKMRTKTRTLFNKAKRDGNWQLYTESLTAYSKEIRKAKRRSFRSFCEDISETPAAARLHRALAKDKTETAVSLKRSDGRFTENDEDKALTLLETHFPGCSTNEVSNIFRAQRRPNDDDWKISKEIFIKDRISWAISTFQPYKTAGVDGVIPVFLQKGGQLLLPHLIRMFRSSFAMGYLPSKWRRAKVTFIPKIGKRDPSNPKSYRPICLTSFMLKTMEKVVDNYLRHNVLKDFPLHIDQHAYRAGRSTETALYQLTRKIGKSIEEKEICICAFLDIEGAFDNTSFNAVEKALEKRNLNATTSRWITEMLKTRTAETQIGPKTIRVYTTRGCPQGGVLSPLIWSLVVDELLHKLSNKGIEIQGYADDIVIIAKGKFEETLCDIIQRGLNTTREWCSSVKLKLNASKTTIVAFTNKRKLERLHPIQLGNEIIEMKQEVKYLGMTLDSKLLWNKHADAVAKKATRAIMVCRSLAGKTWGCKPFIVRWMYIMMVRPIITYGAVAWVKRTKLCTTRKILGKVQRLACICITGALRTCPTSALEVISGLPPLHIVMERIEKETLVRMDKARSEKGIKIDSKDQDRIYSTFPLLAAPRDDIEKTFSFKKSFTSELSCKKDFIDVNTTYRIEPSSIIWYTDGSKTSDGTGAGIYGPRTMSYIPMGINASIFQAEIHAIEQCVQININRGYNNCNIVIFSDSQAAIKALSSNVFSSNLARLCHEKLNELSRNNKVALFWVPGHVGVAGNEIADELARKGASTPLIGPEPFCGLGLNSTKRALLEEEHSKWARHWEEQPGIRQSKALLGNLDRKWYKESKNLNRSDLGMLTGFITGHCRLRGHLRKLGIEDNSTCRFCFEEEETPIHLLTCCGPLNHKRMKCLGNYQLAEKELHLLKPLAVLRFIKETGLDVVL